MAAPVHRLRTPTGTGARKCSNSRVRMEAGRVGGGRSQERPKHFQYVRSLKVYRASRWSAIGLIGDPGPKTVLDDGRLSHGSVYKSKLTVCRHLGLLPGRGPEPC